jgi:hypothetical protein
MSPLKATMRTEVISPLSYMLSAIYIDLLSARSSSSASTTLSSDSSRTSTESSSVFVVNHSTIIDTTAFVGIT